MRNIVWTQELKDRFSEYKSGRMLHKEYGIEMIIFPPFTITRFLMLEGICPYSDDEIAESRKKPSHEEAIADFEKYLKKKTWK